MNKTSEVDCIRARLLTTAVEGIKPVYAVLFQREKTPWPVTLQELEQLPEGSLGNSLARFLSDNGFSLLPLYENHDVYHVLLGYDAEVTDEAAMQFFLLGNRKITPSVVITVFFSLLLLPEHASKFLREYRRGQRCTRIGKWEFLHLLKEPLSVLKALVFKTPVENPPVMF